MIRNIERTKEGLDQMIDRTRDAVVEGAEQAAASVEAAAGRVVDRAHNVRTHLRNGTEKASRTAHRHVQSAAVALDTGFIRVRSDLTRAANTTTTWVAGNPGKTVLLAAAGGFALGLILGRRRVAV